MINFSMAAGLIISVVVLFLLVVLMMVIKGVVCNKFGEDVGLSILIAVMSVTLVLLSAISNR